MAQTAVKGPVIWAKHIHGEDVQARVLALKGGEAIELVVDGRRGPWVRMKEGADGRPTPGIRPVGRAREAWSALCAGRRGELVQVDLARPEAPAQPASSFRDAARAALLRGLSGYRSEGPALSRDDLHDRGLDRATG